MKISEGLRAAARSIDAARHPLYLVHGCAFRTMAMVGYFDDLFGIDIRISDYNPPEAKHLRVMCCLIAAEAAESEGL